MLLEEPTTTLKESAKIEVTSTGTLFVSVPRRDVVQCQLELGDFPFDEQSCYFTVGAWTSLEQPLEVSWCVVGGA